MKFTRVGQKAPGRDGASPQSLGVDVLLAAGELARLVDPAELLDSKAGPRRPLVILAFDEGHMLTDILGEEGCQWSLFSELCHALRTIVGLPICSLFISTSAKFRPFSPRMRPDPSLRLPSLQPITEVSFDDLGFLAIENTESSDRGQMDIASGPATVRGFRVSFKFVSVD